MNKILVWWSDGRSKGTTLFVKKSTVKEGTVAMGEKVKVAWGKTKKLCNAEVLSVGSTPPAPATPRASATEEELFTFELAAAAPRTPTPQPIPSADRQDQKFEDLMDAVSGLEASLLCRFQAIEDKMTALLRKVLETCAPLLPPPVTQLLPAPLPPHPATLPPPSPATIPPPSPATIPPPSPPSPATVLPPSPATIPAPATSTPTAVTGTSGRLLQRRGN